MRSRFSESRGEMQVCHLMAAVHLDIDGAVATITNDNPDKHNAFDDDMDAQLFAALAEIKANPAIRAVIWRGEGKSWSSGRDVGSIGTNLTELSHHELMRRGHRGIQQLWEIDAPVIVACKGWVMGGSFQRALLCDIRVAAEGTRFRLPEVTHGVIPDTGGVAVLQQIAGPGVVSDMVLTGRVMSAEEALGHGVVSRVVPAGELDDTVREMAEAIAAHARGDGETGPAGAEPSVGAARPCIDGRRDDLPDVPQPQRRHGRAASGTGRGPRSSFHRELMSMADSDGNDDGPARHRRLWGTTGPARGRCIRARSGHLRGHRGVRDRSGDGSGQGDRIGVRAPGCCHRGGSAQARASRCRRRRDRVDRCARARAVSCDIRDPDAIATAFDVATEAFGLPGVLVNNAAANFPVPAEDMSPNAWRTVVDITLNGTFMCAREFARRHLAERSSGSILNIGASYAWTGGPGFAHSAAAKAGVVNMTESLAVEWGPSGIQVNCLVPGLFPHEDMTDDIAGNLARTHDKDRSQPALRVGQRQELGWAATFLCSPYARFISGHTLVVDGANWLRRDLTMRDVVPVREQMGRGPFDPGT